MIISHFNILVIYSWIWRICMNSTFKELKTSKTKYLIIPHKTSSCSLPCLNNDSSVLRVYQYNSVVYFLTFLFFLLHPYIPYVSKPFELFLQNTARIWPLFTTSTDTTVVQTTIISAWIVAIPSDWSLCFCPCLSVVYFKHISQSDPFKMDISSCRPSAHNP